MYSFPPLTCSYFALVSASIEETSSPRSGADSRGGGGASTAVAAGRLVDCSFSLTSLSACCGRRVRGVDFAMMASLLGGVSKKHERVSRKVGSRRFGRAFV